MLARIRAGHHIEVAVVLAKPNGRSDTFAIFAECGQPNVFLSLNGRRNLVGHRDIVMVVRGKNGELDLGVELCGVGE